MRLRRLRHARMRAAMTQAQLAEAAGRDRGTISRLETGQRGAQARTARKLADALGVAVEELLGAEREAV